jgi:hypothetical protein
VRYTFTAQRMPLTGGQPTVLVTRRGAPGQWDPIGLTLTGPDLFWGYRGRLHRRANTTDKAEVASDVSIQSSLWAFATPPTTFR